MKPFALFSALFGCAILCASAQAAREACQYVQVADVPVHYRGPGLEITVEGIINRKPATMLVDTGAFAILLTRTGARKHGLTLNGTRDMAEGVGGESLLYQTYLDEFSIGPGKPAKGWAKVLGDTGDTPAYDAIAGAPFLLQMDMELALADKRLKFFKPQGCDDAFLAYWDRKAMVIPVKHNRKDPNPRFTVEVNGVELDAIIDTGVSASSLTARAARGLGLDKPKSRGSEEGRAVGGGTRLARSWTVRTKTIKIGAETILDADLGVVDVQSYMPFDLVLGADFLRAHRVLFAMSQDKLYLSYLGGDVISQRTTIEPWMRKEAEDGNADAQMALGLRYLYGQGVPKDETQARSWIARAATGGHLAANLAEGERLMRAEQYAEAATRYSAALGKMDDGRYEALALYQARVGSKQQSLGAQELAERFSRFTKLAWPGPIAEFYLGRSDAGTLQTQAAAEPEFAHVRGCEAIVFMAELYRLQGNPEAANPLAASWKKTCASNENR